MDSSKLSIKIFAKDGSAVAESAFVPVFHGWIQRQALPEHLLIDVADYKHVPTGPGTVLVSHEANLSMDTADHRPGLLYFRKAPIEGGLAERLRRVFRSALTACQLLEQDAALSGKLSFRTDDAQFRIHDRLFAPNTAATFADVRPTLQSFLTGLYGGPVKLAHEPNEESMFTVHISAPSSSSLGNLLQRLS
jgi:hypothetical protein